jgi:hypothetical protein
VVSPSFLLRRVVGPAGRADNTATSLVATGSYQVTPLRSVPFAAAVASSRQVLSQAPGRWGQGSDPRHDHATNTHGGHGRPTGPKPGITPVAYRVRSHRDHRRDHRSGVQFQTPALLLAQATFSSGQLVIDIPALLQAARSSWWDRKQIDATFSLPDGRHFLAEVDTAPASVVTVDPDNPPDWLQEWEG